MDKEYWIKQAKNALIFVRWCAFAVIIGVVVGAVGAVFYLLSKIAIKLITPLLNRI